ncbi:hypothetical protein TNCV_3909241 [Trichonephila clavipes]|nr:hypothetical protein TNCV_3909241 [Trichonephila clavipes]
MNPIDNVWDALGRRVAGRQPPPTNSPRTGKSSSGRNSTLGHLVVMVTDLRPKCHEFEPSVTVNEFHSSPLLLYIRRDTCNLFVFVIRLKGRILGFQQKRISRSIPSLWNNTLGRLVVMVTDLWHWRPCRGRRSRVFLHGRSSEGLELEFMTRQSSARDHDHKVWCGSLESGEPVQVLSSSPDQGVKFQG